MYHWEIYSYSMQPNELIEYCKDNILLPYKKKVNDSMKKKMKYLFLINMKLQKDMVIVNMMFAILKVIKQLTIYITKKLMI